MVRKFVLITASCAALVLWSLDSQAFGRQFTVRAPQETCQTNVASQKTEPEPVCETAAMAEAAADTRSIRTSPATLTPLKPMIVPIATTQSKTPQISLQANVNAPIARFVKESKGERVLTIEARTGSTPPRLQHSLK
jgi:hypothetical protein